jgi:radical S-adenosyl methionine domain-containing protein 2
MHDAKTVLRLLKEEGMRKINFAGGEPFCEGRVPWGTRAVLQKEELSLPVVTIVTNGSKVNSDWLKAYGRFCGHICCFMRQR